MQHLVQTGMPHAQSKYLEAASRLALPTPAFSAECITAFLYNLASSDAFINCPERQAGSCWPRLAHLIGTWMLGPTGALQ